MTSTLQAKVQQRRDEELQHLRTQLWICMYQQRIQSFEQNIDAEIKHGGNDESVFYYVAECVRNIIIAHQRIAELAKTETATTHEE